VRDAGASVLYRRVPTLPRRAAAPGASIMHEGVGVVTRRSAFISGERTTAHLSVETTRGEGARAAAACERTAGGGAGGGGGGGGVG